MTDTKHRAVELGRRSAHGLHRVATGAERTAGWVDRAVDQVDRLDRDVVERAWSSARRPQRTKERMVAAIILGALGALAGRRLWDHVGPRVRGAAGPDPDPATVWHVDRDEDGWEVLDPRRSQPRSTHRTQADAVAAAERSLADEGGGTVVIHALDGHAREERSVAAVPDGHRG